jgi:hypothetical protein
MQISKTTKALERLNGSIKNLGLAPSARFADIKNTEAGSVFDRELQHSNTGVGMSQNVF